MASDAFDLVAIAVPYVAAVVALVSYRRRKRRAWSQFCARLEGGGLSFVGNVATREHWSLAGSWNGVPVAVDGGRFKDVGGYEARTVFRITEKSDLSSRVGIYAAGSVPVLALAAMGEVAAPSELDRVTHRCFAEHAEESMAWLSGEAWQAIQSLELVRSIDVVDGALTMVVSRLVDLPSEVESCLELVTALHRRERPMGAFDDLGKAVEPLTWEMHVLAPMIMSTVAGAVGAGLGQSLRSFWVWFYIAFAAINVLLLVSWKLDARRAEKKRQQPDPAQTQGPYR